MHLNVLLFYYYYFLFFLFFFWCMQLFTPLPAWSQIKQNSLWSLRNICGSVPGVCVYVPSSFAPLSSPLGFCNVPGVGKTNKQIPNTNALSSAGLGPDLTEEPHTDALAAALLISGGFVQICSHPCIWGRCMERAPCAFCKEGGFFMHQLPLKSSLGSSKHQTPPKCPQTLQQQRICRPRAALQKAVSFPALGRGCWWRRLRCPVSSVTFWLISLPAHVRKTTTA